MPILKLLKIVFKNSTIHWLILVLFLFCHCARGPIRENQPSLRRVDDKNLVVDEKLDLDSLVASLHSTIQRLGQLPDKTLSCGKEKITAAYYAQLLERFLKSLTATWSAESWSKSGATERALTLKRLIGEHFDFYQVYGGKDWGEVMMTGYYQPRIRGSLKPDKVFSEPLRTTPVELVEIDWHRFAELNRAGLKSELKKEKIRGYLRKDARGVLHVQPAPVRGEVVGDAQALQTILAYVDPVDAFLLQIQGSGFVELPSKKVLNIGYDNQNGHAYVAIGKLFFNERPAKDINAFWLQERLKAMPRSELNTVLNQNPSYVYFRDLGQQGARTSLDVTPVGQRTIAVDPSYFSLGLFGFLRGLEGDEVPGRLVLAQDTGGAIRGPGRIDLYTGEGESAFARAAYLKSPAQLWFFCPKYATKN